MNKTRVDKRLCEKVERVKIYEVTGGCIDGKVTGTGQAGTSIIRESCGETRIARASEKRMRPGLTQPFKQARVDAVRKLFSADVMDGPLNFPVGEMTAIRKKLIVFGCYISVIFDGLSGIVRSFKAFIKEPDEPITFAEHDVMRAGQLAGY